MNEVFSGKTVVIVGGTSGIGLAAAETLEGLGARVVVASRSPRDHAQARRRLECDTEMHALDVTDEAAVRAFFECLPPFDHLVTTAAVPATGPFQSQDLASVRALVESKLWGQIHCARHAAPRIRPGGSITFFSGIVSRKPVAGLWASAAVGGAIEALTRALALELAPLRVNCIAPGVVRTSAWSYLPESRREEQLGAIAAGLPVQRVGAPEEVVSALLLLMANGYMTGTILDVDGGHGLRRPAEEPFPWREAASG